MISRITKVLTVSILTICLVGCTSDVKGKKELSVTDELTQNVENIASSITESEIDSGIGSDTGTDTDRDPISGDGEKSSDGSADSERIGSGIMRDSTYTVRFDIDKGEYCPAETLTTRALTAVRTDEGTLVTWRSFGFNGKMYYQLEKNGKLIYEGELTSFLDHDVFDENAVYTLKYPVNEITNEGSFLNTAERTGSDYIETERQRADADNAAGKEQAGWTSGNIAAETAKVQAVPYYEFELQVPPDTKLPNNHFSKHTANDMSVGDLDGDGELELVVKWYPEDAQDNSKDGWTGTTILDGYKLDYNTCTATLMWRIDLGINIRSGAHYTQFQVWDYDGDGCAEIICQTADGTTTYNGKLEETGHVGNASMSTLDSSLTRKKQDYDYRETVNGMGRILSGPEYLTAFSGKTGEIIDTVDYIPARGTEADPKDISSWGDTYGNRSDRFLACTAYIDEGSPAAVFCRGYYARTTIAAWKLTGGKLQLAWYFDAPSDSPYAGQGNHGLSVNDVDGDGFDEIIYGSMIMDNDGSVLNLTGLGHGDAMHVSDWNYDGKLEVFGVHEVGSMPYQIELHDALSGEVLWGVQTGKDTGRGMAADIDPRYEGAEMWAAANSNTFDCNGNIIYKDKKPSVNFSIYWDDDLLTELFDYNNQQEYTPEVQKWDYESQKPVVLLSAKGTATSNGTKGNAGLIADIIGDWREEIVVRCADDASKIRVYTTTYHSPKHVVPCLLADRAYREGIAWQNTAYNQPANLSCPVKDLELFIQVED